VVQLRNLEEAIARLERTIAKLAQQDETARRLMSIPGFGPREMLVSQRTQLLNGLRGHLTEVGVIAAQGRRHARELAELIEACDETVPFEVCEALAPPCDASRPPGSP
jgi:transposase